MNTKGSLNFVVCCVTLVLISVVASSQKSLSLASISFPSRFATAAVGRKFSYRARSGQSDTDDSNDVSSKSSCDGDWPSLTLIGDSTMKRTAVTIAEVFYNCTVSRSGQRCNFPAFYGLEVNASALETRVLPQTGPVLHGLTNRGCQDCGGCEPMAWQCTLFGKPIELEFLGVEFAADVEYPTASHSLTQESVVLGYLKEKVAENDYVVFNTGIHDTVNVGHLPQEFEKQLLHYANLLSQVYETRSILWITNTYPRGTMQPSEWVNVTSATAISGFNEASVRVMRALNIKTLDVGYLSTMKQIQAIYTDGVHVGDASGPWYTFVALSIIQEFLSSFYDCRVH